MHYFVTMDFIDGMGCSTTCETKEEVIDLLKNYDHEGMSWSVEKVEDVTKEIEGLYKK